MFLWPGVGPGIGRHPALGGGPERTHPGEEGGTPSLGYGMLITRGYYNPLRGPSLL